MNKFSELSDFEVNKLVAEKEGFDVENAFIDSEGNIVVLDSYADDRGMFVVRKNYCNNWADAGPLMAENGIATISEDGKFIGATDNSYEYYEPHGDIVFQSNNQNPCRAIAECYLMMKEGEA